jgi:predicted amidophosphoribosyltransferase
VLPALRRTRPTLPQVSLPASRRHRNVRGAFELAPLPLWWTMAAGSWDPRRRSRLGLTRGLIAGRTLVLVDDVATTGASLEACAVVLLREGAREVRAVTAAQALTARPR